MNRHEEMKTILENSSFQLGGTLKSVLLAFVGLGAVGFLVGLFSGHPTNAWQALLVNTIFFAGLSYGGLMFSVIWTITDAKWARPLKRLAEAMAAFVPVSFVLFIILFFGAPHFFEWADHAKVIHTKEGWLNMPFFVWRNLLLFGLTMLVGWFYLKATLRPDIGLAKSLTGFSNSFADALVKNYGDQKAEEEKAQNTNKRLGPLLAILYFLLSSLIAFDWMMSIDQEWFSTMFGVQHLVSNLIAGACGLMIISGYVRKAFKLDDYISIGRYHDISKLAFAACLLWVYMIFSQVLVIWYGNLPEETPYLMLRMQSHEWGWVFWLITFMLFIIPFFGLISRASCNSIWFSRLMAVEMLLGLWMEKYFLIAPSIQENMAAAAAGKGDGGHGAIAGMHLNLFDISITLGMLGIFVLCFFWFLSRVPVVPIADQRFFSDGHH